MEEQTWLNSARKRLEMELRGFNEDPPTHISCGLVSDDMFEWEGIIMGTVDTQLDGCIFQLSIRFPTEYPFSPPQVKLQTKVYHPNVEEDGIINIPLLGDQWSPALTIENLLLSISSLLMDPILQDTDPILEDIQNSLSDIYLE